MSTIPRLGYLCLFDNPSAEDGRALTRQFVLVREADRMGYDDIWIGEHHFDNQWPSAAIVALLGYLSAVTSKARIGALPLAPGLHDPVRLAEDIATLDLLSKGRLNLGLGSGAAFAPALARWGTDAAQASARLHGVVEQAQALLAGPPGEGLLAPRPQQSPLPIWLATGQPEHAAEAARLSWGLAAAASHTAGHWQALLAAYRAANGQSDPRLVLARFACTAASAQEAQAIARPYLEAFAQRARAAGWGTDPALSAACDVDALLAQSLIGSHQEVADRMTMLGAQGVASVAIIPTSAQFDTVKHILADFVDEVRPLLMDY